jgi:hypothetical protein
VLFRSAYFFFIFNLKKREELKIDFLIHKKKEQIKKKYANLSGTINNNNNN